MIPFQRIVAAFLPSFGAIALLGLFSTTVQAQEKHCRAESGATAAMLVELFTSEGCNSCPPAERWLSQLGRGKRAGEVVPLAWHVDYWNHLGWEDPYALPHFSLRQRRYAAARGSRTVYTPQVVVNGEEHLGWRWGDGLPKTRAKQGETPAARIDIEIVTRSPRAADVSARARLDGRGGGDADLFLAIYETELTNAVKAGENAGKTLRHDYVVRRLLGPYPNDGGAINVKESLRIEGEWTPSKTGVAAFLQRRNDLKVLQALALPFCF